jgi:hypothetical protein
MSAWLSDGKGGFRVAYGLRDFPITRSPHWDGSAWSNTSFPDPFAEKKSLQVMDQTR